MEGEQANDWRFANGLMRPIMPKMDDGRRARAGGWPLPSCLRHLAVLLPQVREGISEPVKVGVVRSLGSSR